MNITFTDKQLKCLRQLMRLNLIEAVMVIARTRCLNLIETNDAGNVGQMAQDFILVYDRHNLVDIPMQVAMAQKLPLYTLSIPEAEMAYFKAILDSPVHNADKEILDFIEQEREGLKLAMAGSRDLGNVFAMNCPKEIQ